MTLFWGLHLAAARSLHLHPSQAPGADTCARNTKASAPHHPHPPCPPGCVENVIALCIRGDIFGKVWAARSCICVLENNSTQADFLHETNSSTCSVIKGATGVFQFAFSLKEKWQEGTVTMTTEVTDSTHVCESRQQVEGEEGLGVRGGLGPAQRGTSQRRQNAVTHIT